MADIVVRPTEPGDTAVLAANLRQTDLDEIAAAGCTDALDGVERSVASSLLCWTAFAGGELACIVGVAPISIIAGTGSPWMLGTNVLDRHWRALVRRTPGYIDRMQTAFPHLYNHAHAENRITLGWLRRLGFTVRAPEPHPVTGAMFHKFERHGHV